MKKFIFLVFFLCFSFNAYTFWIWSPKTQKWKNPKYSALATPYLQFKDAEKLFNEEKYKQAYKSFKKLLINYPNSQEAAEAQYFLAQCLEKLSKPYDAYVEYQKLIDSYPNSKRINQAVEHIYNIGEYFLNREHKKVLGVSVYDFVDHPAVEIFQRIVEKVPYCEYAPRAQYKLGMIFMELGRYDEARDAFQKTIDSYPDSEWAAPAKYQLALATAKAFPGAQYDATYLKEASTRLDEFISEHPEAKISSEAGEQLTKLRNSEAKKYFEIAEFYEKQNKYQSALIYYRRVVNSYSDSSYYDESLKRAGELTEIIRDGITRKQYEKQKKREKVEDEKAKQLRSKQDRVEVKEALKLSKMQETLAKVEERTSSKGELVQQKLEGKQEVHLAKLKKIEDAKIKNESLRLEKQRKQEAADEARRKRIAEAKAQKEAQRQERLLKKEEVLASKRSLQAEKPRPTQTVSTKKKQQVTARKKDISEDQSREQKTDAQIQRIQEGLKVQAPVALTESAAVEPSKQLEAKEQARQEKLKQIEVAKIEKEALRLEQLRKKEETRKEEAAKTEKAIAARLEKKEEAAIEKEALRLEKQRKQEAARLAEDKVKAEAVRDREVLRLEKLAKKEQAREQKVKKIEETKAKRQALQRERLRKQEAAGEARRKRIAEAKARKDAQRQEKLKKQQEALALKEAARQEKLRRKKIEEINKSSDIVKEGFSQQQLMEQKTDGQLQKIQEGLAEIKSDSGE